MEIEIRYFDGFTGLLISYEALVSSQEIKVSGKWFNPQDENPSCQFNLESDWQFWTRLEKDLRELEAFYSLSFTDLHEISLRIERDQTQYKRTFYGLEPGFYQKYPSLKDKLYPLEQFMWNIRRKIENIAGR